MKKLIWFIWFCYTDAILIAYDCKNPSANITAISLRDVSRCPDAESGYLIEKGYIQILEKRTYEYVQVYSCLVEITRLISYCAMFSHMGAVDGGLSSYIYEMGGEECRKTHAFQQFKGIHGHVINKLKPNATTSISLTLAGKVDNNHNCEGAQYIEDGRKWDNVVVQAEVRVTLQDYLTKVALDDNEIHLQNGVKCPFLNGYCMDTNNGESTWEQNFPQTCKQFNVLHEGLAEFVTEKSKLQNGQQYVVVEEKAKVFAIQLIKREKLCGVHMWQSEHPRLLVLRKKYAIDYTPFTANSRTHDADLITYVNTKFLYVEQSFKRSINELIAYAVHRRCLLHREILKNRLAMASVNPNAIAGLIKNNLGFVARVSGEVLYIMKCLALPVEIRREKKCYSELPVTAYNKSFYMSPVTRILQEHAEEIECNAIIPSMYFIENKWVGFDPYPSQAIEPQELRVDEERPPKFHTIKDLGAGGLYTYQEIRKPQHSTMFNLERNALNNILIRKIAGHDVESQGITTLNLFSKEEMENLANSALRKLYGYFTILGEWTSGILGIYFLFRALKCIIEIFLNAVALHRVGGCSLHLIASFWNTLTLFVLHHKQRKHYTKNQESYARNTDNPDDDLREAEVIKTPSAPKEQFTTVKIENERPKLAHDIPKNDKTSNYSTLRTNLKTLNPIPEHLATLSWSMYENTDLKTTNKK